MFESVLYPANSIMVKNAVEPAKVPFLMTPIAAAQLKERWRIKCVIVFLSGGRPTVIKSRRRVIWQNICNQRASKSVDRRIQSNTETVDRLILKFYDFEIFIGESTNGRTCLDLPKKSRVLNATRLSRRTSRCPIFCMF